MTSLPATIARGYQVASGANASPRFPGGTLRMQYDEDFTQTTDEELRRILHETNRATSIHES